MIFGPRLPATWSQWTPSSKNASPPRHLFVVAPVSGGLEAAHNRHEVPEDHLADGAGGEKLPEFHGERFVVIILAHDDDPPGSIALGPHELVIGHLEERRLLDEHVFAGAREPFSVRSRWRRGGTATTTASTNGSAIASS